MSLLLKTDIENKIRENIHGSVARIGGSVGQLVRYEECKVTDINILDGGFGKIDKLNTKKKLINKLRYIKKAIKQEYLHYKQGEVISRDRKTIIMDMHSATNHIKLKHKYDCTISSNMIEHSPNPIWLLLNFHFITKENGCQYHAIPHYKYTYDCYRIPTSLDHLKEDFIKMKPFTDDFHNDDYIESAVVRHGWQKKFHEKYPVAYPYMHFHVFDENNTYELFNMIFEGVVNDIIKTEKFSDNVVIYRNKLKHSFIKEYEPIIEKYSKDILGQ